MDRLSSHGFEKVVVADLAFGSTVELFKSASHVVGLHGAGMTYITFCPSGARVLECFHPMYGTASYAPIALSLDLDYATMVAKDAISDDPLYNDTALQEGRNLGSRSVRLDLDEIEAWACGRSSLE